MDDSITPMLPQAFIPSGYAEKAMASLMQLHSELMDEKERRVDLYRRLMERDQVVAELRMYVKMLESKLGPRPDPLTGAMPGREEKSATRPASAEPPRQAASPVTPRQTAPRVVAPTRAPATKPAFHAAASRGPVVSDARFDGWKQW